MSILRSVDPPIIRALPAVVRPALALLVGAVLGCGGRAGGTEPADRVLQLEVAEAKVPCVGVGPQECLRVRERADGEWQLFYDAIVGFDYVAGYRYILRVVRRPVRNPPADGSSAEYRLLDVISKTRVSP